MYRSLTFHDFTTEKQEPRLMERAGIGPKSARSIQWFDSERETYQHHAEYLKRLSKLREELINQEQTNLANALERLRMRSYGREYIYSRPKEKKGHKQTSAAADAPQRKSLVTTLEKFQKMRPKKTPPQIMPLHGKSLLETQPFEKPATAIEREIADDRSVDENVRLNLQRLTAQRTASIPRMTRTGHALHSGMVLESKQIKRSTVDHNNSSALEEKLARKHQRSFRMRHETDKVKLTPQSVKLDSADDEDRMNVDKLKDLYCVYYVSAPAPSPINVPRDSDISTSLPSLTNHACAEDVGRRNGRIVVDGRYGMNRLAHRSMIDFPGVPPCTCNCANRMFVTGSKMEVPQGHVVDENGNFYHRMESGSKKSDTGSSQFDRRSDRTGVAIETVKSAHGQEKKQIVVDMPAIVFNSATPDKPPLTDRDGHALTKAFKQKELRQRELSNLLEDVREINKRTETLADTNP